MRLINTIYDYHHYTAGHNTGKRILSCPLIFAFGLFFALWAAPASAAQSVIINTDVGNTSVYGNSPNLNGLTAPGNDTLTASGNSVTLQNGGVAGSVLGGVYGSEVNTISSTSSNISATGNSVNVTGGTVTSFPFVVGGYAIAEGSGTAEASGNNTVNTSGGTVNAAVVVGGYALTSSGAATAYGNTMNISGGEVNGDCLRRGSRHQQWHSYGIRQYRAHQRRQTEQYCCRRLCPAQ
jgi:hypothetical protein